MKYMGTTLVKASALLMCSLSVLFAYKVGLFNIGAAGQYVSWSRSFSVFCVKAWYALVCMHDRSNRYRSPGRRHLWCTEGLFQCKRSYFLYHAELDFPVCGEYDSYPGKAESTPYTEIFPAATKQRSLLNCGLDATVFGNNIGTIGLYYFRGNGDCSVRYFCKKQNSVLSFAQQV